MYNFVDRASKKGAVLSTLLSIPRRFNSINMAHSETIGNFGLTKDLGFVLPDPCVSKLIMIPI